MAPLFADYSGKIETNLIDDGGMILRIRAIRCLYVRVLSIL